MTDIIERLRGYAGDDHERGCNGRYYDCSCGYDKKLDPLLIEAADEIERLRATLDEAEKICRDKQRERKDAQSCADAIRKLKGKHD